MKELLEKILGQIKKTPSGVRAYEDLYHICLETQKTDMSTLPALFEGAFLAHHRFEKKEVINEIFSHMTNKEELIGKLAEMYNEPIMALVEEPEESEGNVSWTASW